MAEQEKDLSSAEPKSQQAPESEPQEPLEPEQAPEESVPAQDAQEPQKEADGELKKLKDKLAESENQYLRLCAEYDNFRKRTAREKERAWTDCKAETVLSFLSVYDNLERALKQPCADEAYAKGVEMTMNGLKDTLTKMGVEEVPALGETFDPNVHNAVMHTEDENVEENTIVEVFQAGFRIGEKIIRPAMVKVAN